MSSSTSTMIGVAEIKAATAEHCPDILSNLAGLPPEILDGKQHP
jgi:hypothetical protein